MTSDKQTTIPVRKHKLAIHRIIWRLYERGMTQREIAQIVDYTQANVCLVINAIKKVGFIQYKVGAGAGRGSYLSASDKKRFTQLINRGAKAYGFKTDRWTQKRVQMLIDKEFGVHYSLCYVSTLLNNIGVSLREQA